MHLHLWCSQPLYLIQYSEVVCICGFLFSFTVCIHILDRELSSITSIFLALSSLFSHEMTVCAPPSTSLECLDSACSVEIVL